MWVDKHNKNKERDINMTVKFWIEDEQDLALKEKMILKLCKIKDIILHDVSFNRMNLYSERTGKQITEYTVTFLELKENR